MKKLILIMAVTLSGQLMAQSAATVLFARNTLTISSGRDQHTASRGDKLNAGDSIKVKRQGLSKLKYNNGTIVTLGADTEYKILAYSPSQADVQIKAELKKGRLESQTSGKKDNRELLKTPTVAFAIIGTEYKSFVQGQITYTQVESGTVYAGDQLLQTGVGYQISAQGIVAAEFPSSGNINSISASTPASAANQGQATIASEANLVATTTVVSSSGQIPTEQLPIVPVAPVGPAAISIIDCTTP